MQCSAARLGRAACDSEFANFLLGCGALHSKMSADELAKVQMTERLSRAKFERGSSSFTSDPHVRACVVRGVD